MISIVNIERILPNNVVKTIYWMASLTVNNLTAAEYGSTNLLYKSPTDPTFVQFENLDENQVIDWVEKQVDIRLLNKKLEAQVKQCQNLINSQNQSNSALGIPWKNV